VYICGSNEDFQEANMKEKGFHNRGFITFLTALSFLIMTLTGIVLYFVPHGRVAYWVDWRFFGLTKTNWGNIHIVSSILFAAAGVYHIYYNWKPLVNYIVNKISGGLRLKKELAIACLISVFVILGSIYLIPPVNYVIEFSEYLKKSWVVSKEYEPPFGHAEEISLKVFTKKMSIDLDKALIELKKKGVVVEDVKDSLAKIARANRTTPMKLYMIIKKHEQKREPAKRRVYTPEMVEEVFAGTGLGRKTLSQICKELGVDINHAKEKLSKNNIRLKDDDTLKEAANSHDIYPLDILKVILVDNYKR
jgi:hypothetical protein